MGTVTNLPSRNQIPLNRPLEGANGLVTQPWAFWFQQFVSSMPPVGSGFIVDTTATSYAATTFSQGLASQRGSSPAKGAIYFAIDTGQIFISQGGTWVEQTPALTGDVHKDKNSNVTTLANVNPTIGTWGGTSEIPVFTVDAKGRITSVSTVPITAKVVAAGVEGSVQINQGGQTRAGNLVYNSDLDKLLLQNLGVMGVISFASPISTFKNLSPLTTKGDVLTFDGANNVRLGIGTENQVLAVQAGTAVWKGSGRAETRFTGTSNIYLLPANAEVYSVELIINTPFNAGTTIEVGDTVLYDSLMAIVDNDPTDVCTFQTYPGLVFSAQTQLTVTVNGATTGSGTVVLHYSI